MKTPIFTLDQVNDILDNAVMTEAQYETIRNSQNQLLMIQGRAKQVLNKRQTVQQVAHIDWLHFTCHEDAITHLNPQVVTDFDLIIEVSSMLENVFGFGITLVRPNGANFYARSYTLGSDYGMVCHGGNNQTLLVSVNATGLTLALEGWENRCYQLLNKLMNASITRIDLAHDDFEPTFFTVDNMLLEFHKGAFNNGNRSPSVSQAGNWIKPDGKGRTFYVGKRTNGLYLRIYEKGLQLKSLEFPNWVRVEAELKSTDRHIPFDVLLRPHEYLAGTYPVLRRLTEKQEKIKTYQHEVKADINHRILWGKRQNGSLIQLLTQLNYSELEIINMLKSEKLPPKFKQKFLDSDLPALHNLPRSYVEPTQSTCEILELLK